MVTTAAGPEDPLQRVELQLALLLRRVEGIRDTESGGTGGPALDRSSYLLLLLLEEGGPLGISALAEQQGLDGSTVTRQVAALERTRLARRGRDPEDGRAVVVAATRHGLEALGRERERRRTRFEEVLARWSPSERSQLAGLLERLNQDLDDWRRRPSAP
ncbi:MarR family winged helix-turn-helix transcriptional regulator [Antribacter gilvus]|uniref:MarR family winged helix-turn-helix transcriptional regulator n=1 Tax=Antribacter gilvus TaxID=2304675 RepID=UPI000F7965FB|nr:MarR family transcriptional regulator [Antribacter gilvus]